MKTWTWAFLAAITGMVIGLGITVAEFAPVREVFHQAEESSPTPTDIENLGGKAKAVVEGTREFDFGVLERNVKGHHHFVIRNEGTSPLTIKVGQPTCKCTVAKNPKDLIPPGESTEIEMEWEATGYQEDFRQSVELETNDLENPIIRLVIHGNIIQSVRPFPEEVTLSGVSASEGTTAEVRVFGFMEEPLEITGHSLVNADYADSFELAVSPLSQADIAAQPQAKSGYLVRLAIKSGLPIGALNQTIRLETNAPTAPTIEVPVHLTIVSDISILSASPGVTFQADKNLLRLGKLRAEKGATIRMFVLVKGPHRNETTLNIASIEPSTALTATLGAATSLSDGAVLKYPLELAISPGTAPISRYGGEQGELGKVVLETTHPVAKEVRLFVQFAVE